MRVFGWDAHWRNLANTIKRPRAEQCVLMPNYFDHLFGYYYYISHES